MAGKTLNKKKIRKLMEAIKEDRFEEFVEILGDGFGLDSLLDNDRTPLMSAAGNSNVKMVKYLLEKNASVRTQNSHEYDALYYAIGPDYSSWSKQVKEPDQRGTIKELLGGGASCRVIHLIILLINYDEEMISFFSQHWRHVPDRSTVEKAILAARKCFSYEGSVDSVTLKENIRKLLSLVS